MHKVDESGLIHQERICCKVESAWPENIIYFHVWKVEDDESDAIIAKDPDFTKGFHCQIFEVL